MAMLLRYLAVSLIASTLFSAGLPSYNDVLENRNRNGLLFIEVAHTVLEIDGDIDDRTEPGYVGGYDSVKGWYVAFEKSDGWEVGDKALTVFVYNPLTNHIDDILFRHDVRLPD